MIPYVIAGALALSVAAGVGGYVKGREDGSEKWIPMVAELEAQIHQMKSDGDARAKRAEAVAKTATAELAKARKEAEAERGRYAAIVDRWNVHLDNGRVRPADGDAEAALAACRSDESAARRAIGEVVRAALDIRTAAVVNTRQLEQLQEWVREVTR